MQFDPEAFYQAERASQDQDLFKQIDKTQYINAIKRLPSFGISLGGISVGGAVMNGNRFHIAVQPVARGLVGGQIMDAFDWGFSLADPFLAVVAKGNLEALGLIKRYTHELVDQDAETLTYKIFKGR
jgi:hypothetical protein